MAKFLSDTGATRGQRVLDVANAQLVEAASNGDLEACARAIAAGAEVDQGDYDLRTVRLLTI